MSSSENPFASPRVTDDLIAEAIADASEAEQIRRLHISHETSMRSIGILYYLGMLMVALAGIANLPILVVDLKTSSPPARVGILIGAAMCWMLLLGVQFFIARGLRKLDPRVKVPLTVCSVIGLVQIPCGTFLNVYVLYLIWSRKGTMVFSPEYKLVIRDTPHVRYKTSTAAWIVLAVFLFLVGLGIVVAIFEA